MKKFILTALSADLLCAGFALCGCAKSVDYFDYVSENRESVYLYEDDFYTVKIYCKDVETPYSLDGSAGKMTKVTEIYYYCDSSPLSVSAYINGEGGEMSYMSVGGYYYLSLPDKLTEAESVTVEITADGKTSETVVKNVAEKGTITPREAISYASEYDSESFEKLKSGGAFYGEISVRLIYDNGCYYYVGLCDREKNIKSYLVDGTNGRIIAERESSAE